MDYQELKKLQQSVFARCLELTEKKGNDYSKGNQDVLKIFKESADEFGVSLFVGIGYFLKKHINAVYHYCKTGGQSESEPIRERVVDAINYLTFILAAIEEEEANKEQKKAPAKKSPFVDEGITELQKAIEDLRKRQAEQHKVHPPVQPITITPPSPWIAPQQEPWIQPYMQPTPAQPWNPSTISYCFRKNVE